MASAPEPDVRPVRPAAGSGDVPAIAWPLVERRRPRSATRSGPDRRSAESGHGGNARLSQSAAPPLAPFRWVAIGVGLGVAWPDLSTTNFRLLFAALLLIAYPPHPTWRPIP